MKNILLIAFFLYTLAGCKEQQLTRQETVKAYYTARDKGDFKTLKSVINDSITLTAGDFVMPYGRNSFYKQFQWDSVFKPSYSVIKLEEQQQQIIATISQQNLRNAFLKNNPLVFNVKVSFNEGKISRIEELDYIDVDWNAWAQERDTLVSWIATNHPELDGFVNDMTMKGAMNYLRAIELYKFEKE